MDAAELTTVVTRVAQSDRAAFSELYRATSAKLYGVVLRILNRRDLADEVLQEVYLKIWERAAEFDASRSSPITWLVTIARNRAIDVKRRRETVALDDAPEIDEIAGDDINPLAGDELRQDLQRVQQCLEGIEAEKRNMILLAYYRGLSREQLAERFAAPVATIKTWLRRSLTQLRLCMEG
jgi:RNA polymerase sigma-70 factor (ECF subfamily)